MRRLHTAAVLVFVVAMDLAPVAAASRAGPRSPDTRSILLTLSSPLRI